MRFKFLSSAFLILTLVVLTSCSTYYYYPTPQTVLKFTEKGDIGVEASTDFNGYDRYSAGIALTDFMAVNADINTFRKQDYENNNYSKYRDYMINAELILYHRWREYFYPAVNLGFGTGEIDRYNPELNVNINRVFLQPSVGFSNDYFDFALANRFSWVDYPVAWPGFDNTEQFNNYREKFSLGDIGKKEFYFTEPSITFGIGYKWVKLRYQMCWANQLSSNKIRSVDSNSILSVNVKINPWKIATELKKPNEE